VIAVARSSGSFAKLANYLVKERDGIDRVDWVTSRNLPTADPRLAAEFMRATAAANPRVAEPVYHLAVSFHPGDVVTRETMERVAARLLADLKLQGHQVVIVAHKDRPHAHFHLMVNRVDPDTGRAWNRWQDQVITQRVLREEERALGLREVRGRLYRLPGQEMPERATRTSGELRQAVRSGIDPLVDRVRAHAYELRGVRSWGELHARLGVRGFHLERKGQGVVITDGETEVKASRVHRDLSFKSLERRLGPYEGRAVQPDIPPALLRPVDMRSPATAHVRGGDVVLRAAGGDPGTPAVVPRDPVADAATLLRTAERTARVDTMLYGAKRHREALANTLPALDTAVADVRTAGRAFEQALGRVYHDPAHARAMFDHLVRTVGADTARQRLHDEPAAFGALVRHERRVVFGLFPVPDPDAAQVAMSHARHGAAAVGRTAERVYELTGYLLPRDRSIDPRRPEAVAQAVTHGTAQLERATRRLGQVQALRATLPDRRTLDKAIGGLALGLLPKQVSQVALLLTAPERAILSAALTLARDLALGRGRGR
jgi:hypothetical protein